MKKILSNLPTQIRTRQSRLFITKSRQVLDFSKDRNSATLVDNMLHCLTNLSVEKCCPRFTCNFLYFCLCSLPVVLSVGTTWKCLIPSSLLSLSGIYTHEKSPLILFFLRLNSPRSLSVSSLFEDLINFCIHSNLGHP